MKYDERLKELREKISQKESLEAKCRELKAQREELDSRVQELESVMQKEWADVDRLEHMSLSALFYTALGKKEERLEKEKLEAYAAKAKYDSAVRELRFVEEDIRCVEEQLAEIVEGKREYEELLQKKMAEIKASHLAEAAAILRLEEQIAVQESRRKEISEAITAGSCALHTTEQILGSLDDAENWSTWDVLGGGLIADIEKHSHLDEAQSQVQQLQSELRQFKTELADVTIQAEIQVSIDDFLRFADYFFDGLFADWAVMNQITESQASVQNTKSQIEAVLSDLRRQETAAEEKMAALEAEKAAVIESVAL